MIRYEVAGHEASLLPEGKKWKLVWADEFDGTELDRTKWDYRLCMMGKRHVTWDTEGVRLDGNSNAVFTIYEKDGEICSSGGRVLCVTALGDDLEAAQKQAYKAVGCIAMPSSYYRSDIGQKGVARLKKA